MPFRGHVQTQVSAKLENDLIEHTTGMWGRGAPRGEREGRTGDASFSRANVTFVLLIYEHVLHMFILNISRYYDYYYDDDFLRD